MACLTLSAELTREHHEIDDAIETFIEKLDCGSVQRELLTDTLEALRRHIYLEEVFLFPPLREAGIVYADLRDDARARSAVEHHGRADRSTR